MSTNKEVIQQFIEAWPRLDAAELSAYFTEDGVYHNMPAGPVQGRDKIEEFIANFIAAWTQTEWQILNLVGDGDIIIAERLDKTKIGEKSVDLPCTGVFEMENGSIKVWRDYFDLGTYMKVFE
jgi:limonene-1,2-epoxide hydrolase